MVKNLQKIDRLASYQEAKKQVKIIREEQPGDDTAVYRIIFAESELEAEEKLQVKREAPIIQEWEK